MRPSLTLNLGLRYEFYGVPYEGQGLSIIPKNGGGLGLFGVSGRSFDRWMRPNNGVDLSLLTDLEFVGPKTSQPDKSIYPNDWNNFGPAVGSHGNCRGSAKERPTCEAVIRSVSWAAVTQVS